MYEQNGVVSCGHQVTADTAIKILRSGGNAVDAMVAAAFVSFVCELPLTGIGGGGHMMVSPPDAETELLDFFVRAPGLSAAGRADDLHFEDVEIDFGPVKQVFHVGYGATAVPGNPHGLVTAHKRWGSVSLADLLQPAIQLAEKGLEVTQWAEIMFDILAPIATFSKSVAAIFAPDGRLLRRGDHFEIPELATVFRAIAQDGIAGFYSGEIASAMLNAVNSGGGVMTATDLEQYETIIRRPLMVDYKDHRIALNPPPSLGGLLIALGLEQLGDTQFTSAHPRAKPAIEKIFQALDFTQFTRETTLSKLDPSNAFETLTQPETWQALTQRYHRRASGGNTTHISIIDRNGMIASATTSYGEGNGHLIEGLGLTLNNMLGEEDLNPDGFHLHAPGARLPSMMCPLTIRGDRVGLLAVGSGGSNRIRTALLQVILNVIDFEMPLADAINYPRLHWEGSQLEIECGIDVPGYDSLGVELHRWARSSLFFGGAHGVRRDANGHYSGAGDPRRYGVVEFV